MKKTSIIILTAFLWVSFAFADEIMQPSGKERIPVANYQLHNITPLPKENNPVPNWEFITEPTAIMTSWYDYMPSSYESHPLRLQSDNGNGLYYTWHALPDDAPGTKRKQYYAYINSSGVVQDYGAISTSDIKQGYGTIDVIPGNGDAVVTWHQRNAVLGYGTTIAYDNYAMLGIPGFWSSYLFIPPDTPGGNEYIWPNINVGPSPLGDGYVRVYQTANNYLYNSFGHPCEDVRIMFCDVENSLAGDVSVLLDLGNWSEVTPMYYWRAKDCRPQSKCFVIDPSTPGRVALIGFASWLSGDLGDMPVNPGMWVWESLDYGATWDQANLHCEPDADDWFYLVDNIPQIGGPPIPDFLEVSAGGWHCSARCDNAGNIYWAYLQQYGYTDAAGSGFYFPNFMPMGIATWDGVEFTWDEVPEMPGIDPLSGHTVPWEIVGPSTLTYPIVGWSTYEDQLFHENTHKLAINESNGWLAQLWADGTYLTLNSLGVPGYEDYATHPILYLSVSGDFGVTWTEPIELTDIYNPDIDFMNQITVYPYLCNEIVDLGDGWGQVHISYFDDNSFGSFPQGGGLNTGGQITYCSVKINFGESLLSANFSADQTSGLAPLTVNFTDQSTPGTEEIDEWSWDFGDGDNSDEQNPAHIYENPGTYTVSLTVTDGTNTDTEIKTDYIYVQVSTSIYDIQYTTEPGPEGTYPSLMEGQTVITSGIVTAIEWAYYYKDNFFISMPEGGAWKGILVFMTGDTTLVPGDEVEVTGTVDEYNGMTEISGYSDPISITLLSSGNPIPEPTSVTCADLAPEGVGEPYEGVLVELNDVTVIQEPDEFGKWLVDDGTGIAQIDDSFFYLDEVDPPIVITVGMEWEIIRGCLGYSYGEYGLNPRTPDDLIENINPPTADFVADTTSGFAPLTVNFTDQSTPGTGAIEEWYWNFGDGDNSTYQNPTHIYDNPGTYTVSLTVTDEYDSTDTETKIDYINVFGTVSTQTFNPPAGTYTEPQYVKISCSTPDAIIHYTMDGTDPDENSIIYTDSILVDVSVTLKSRAYKHNWIPSEIAEAIYIIEEYAPYIFIDHDSLAFGNVTIGDVSSIKSFYIFNQGNENLEIYEISTPEGFEIKKGDAGDWVISISNFIIQDNSFQKIYVRFIPADTGSYSGDISISSNDPDEDTVYVNVSGTGVEYAVPNIEINPTEIQFGSVTILTSKEEYFKISNTGSAELIIDSISVPLNSGFMIRSGDSGEYSTSIHEFSILPETEKDIYVKFSPSITGYYSAYIHIISNDPEGGNNSVFVTGTGVNYGVPNIEINPLELHFGEVELFQNVEKTLTISNTGNAVLEINDIHSLSGYKIKLDGGVWSNTISSFDIQSLDEKVIHVQFYPEALISYNGFIYITSNDPDEGSIPIFIDGTGVPVISEKIPDAFTPNGDGLNDEFIIGPFQESVSDEVHFKVYDLRGKLIHETKGQANIPLTWDGNDDSGNKCTSGAYIYVYRINDNVFKRAKIYLIR